MNAPTKQHDLVKEWDAMQPSPNADHCLVAVLLEIISRTGDEHQIDWSRRCMEIALKHGGQR